MMSQPSPGRGDNPPTLRIVASAGQSGRRKAKPKEFASVEHLSLEAVAAFVDGELTPIAMHRARVHLVHCEECRAEVAQQRRASEQLKNCVATETIKVSTELKAKLTSIAFSCPAGPNAEETTQKTPNPLLEKVDFIYRAVRRSAGK